MTMTFTRFVKVSLLGLSLVGLQGLSANAEVLSETELEELLAKTPETAVQNLENDTSARSEDVQATTASSPENAVVTAEEIEAATYDGAPLAEGRTALTAKVQILLDRAGISPGVIDGYSGDMSRTAIMAFEGRAGLSVDGVMDQDVWNALGGSEAQALTTVHVISSDDIASLSQDPLPSDYAELAELAHLGYTTPAEMIAETYHMDEDFLRSLNPNASWTTDETITVVDPAVPGASASFAISRIIVDKARSRLVALDNDGVVLADYPVTVGSDGTPSPTGTHKVRAIAMNPTYSYNPDLNFQQGDNTEPLTLPPGPNGPVGSVWIDLDKPTYGLHGTPHPDKLFTNQSHGCVRLTNWDAADLAAMVSARMSEDNAEIEVVFSE